MAQVDEGWCGDKDDLQHPETDVGDGKCLVIANVFTTGLLCVTGKVWLLVTPNFFSCCTQHQNSKDEEDCEPNLGRTNMTVRGTVVSTSWIMQRVTKACGFSTVSVWSTLYQTENQKMSSTMLAYQKFYEKEIQWKSSKVSLICLTDHVFVINSRSPFQSQWSVLEHSPAVALENSSHPCFSQFSSLQRDMRVYGEQQKVN